MEHDARIYVAGHKGLAGSAIWRALEKEGYNNLIGMTSKELDLRSQEKTRDFIRLNKPKYVFDAAARVGGLNANNTLRADFIYDNLAIQNNLIHSCWEFGVEKMMFLSSNCVYPRESPQPMREEQLLTGQFEPTNQPYAVAKIAGMEMCDGFNRQHGTNFLSVIPASLYGPRDTYDSARTHIVPTLIKICHEAKKLGENEVILGGSRQRRREHIFSDDFGDACVFLMNQDFKKIPNPINIGVSYDMSLSEIAESVKKTVGFGGDIKFDESKPTGMLRKFLDSSHISALGWKPKISFEKGLDLTYKDFIERFGN